MVDFSLPVLCVDCLYERQQQVAAVVFFAGVNLCATCRAARQLNTTFALGLPLRME